MYKRDKRLSELLTEHDIYSTNVSEPWFTLIKLGIKTVEGTLNKTDFYKIKIGDTIIFTNFDFDFERKIYVKIINIKHYDTFKLYLQNEKLENCLPGVDTIEEGIKIFYNFYTSFDEYKNKVKAIQFEKYDI
jgi:ASC-1-like (ASCH) protein